MTYYTCSNLASPLTLATTLASTAHGFVVHASIVSTQRQDTAYYTW